MRSFIVILFLTLLNHARCGSPAVEIQKQRLLSLPQQYARAQSDDHSLETQRIIDEINRVNVALGYIKPNPFNSNFGGATPRKQVESYFYPRPAYHPVHHRYDLNNDNNVKIRTSYIRELNDDLQYRRLPIINTNSYFNKSPPSSHLQLPEKNVRRSFKNTNNNNNLPIPKYYSVLINDDYDYDVLDNANYKNTLNSNYHKLNDNYINYRQNKAQQLFKTDHNTELLNIVRQTIENSKQRAENLNESNNNNDQNIIYKTDSSLSKLNLTTLNKSIKKDDILNIVVISPVEKSSSSSSDNKNMRTLLKTNIPEQSKTIFRKKPTAAATVVHHQQQPPVTKTVTTTKAPAPIKHDAVEQQKLSQKKPQTFQSLQNDDIEPLPSAESEKGPFGNIFNRQQEQITEALKEGGIIIQRLRVRHGGIAIAGPGGVATAGSGGTAIVGPGGIALTHPRSLAIAGPGARVVAVPEGIDLRQLALQQQLQNGKRSFSPSAANGIVVATGPVVYYNPPVQ